MQPARAEICKVISKVKDNKVTGVDNIVSRQQIHHDFVVVRLPKMEDKTMQKLAQIVFCKNIGNE